MTYRSYIVERRDILCWHASVPLGGRYFGRQDLISTKSLTSSQQIPQRVKLRLSVFSSGSHTAWCQ